MNQPPVRVSVLGMDQMAADGRHFPVMAPLASGERQEVAVRLAADRDAIIAALLGSIDPGPVTVIEPGPARPPAARPPAAGSLAVGHWVATFADGRRLIYRPASFAGHACFGGVLDWLRQRIPQAGLRYAAVLPRPGYGWVEYIDQQPLSTPAGADRYYRRHGMLLAAAYALDVPGIRARHLVANGDCPVVVNAEAAFHSRPPEPADPADPAAVMLASSVHRVGLLRALGHDRRAPSGRPALEPAVLAGFRLGYDAITAHRGDLTRLLSGIRDVRYPAADTAIAKIAGLSDVDRHDQEWVISATLRPRDERLRTAVLATPLAVQLTPASAAPAGPPSAEPLASIAAEPARLLAVACGLADQIVARCLASESGPHPGRVNWLGLQPGARGEWEVLPMGADLANGYLGVALFLAQLAELTGVGRYAEVARQALNGWPSLLTALRGQPELLAATGCGGYDGLGGMSYGLARMATLLRDPRLSDWASTAIGLAAATAGPAARPGWADGSAGCLAAMMAVHSETGSPDAVRLAETIAGRLSELVDQTDGWCVPAGAPSRDGFAWGPAGVGWALTRFGAVHGQPAYAGTGRRAVLRAVSLADAAPDLGAGWCLGTAGLLAARCCLADEASLGRLRADLLAIGRRPVQRDLSLAHGELGLTQAISVASATVHAGPGQPGAASQSLRRRAGLVLDALRRRSDYCGAHGVPAPGLLHGLAGIGYGLLRLAFPGQVPPVLLLEPAPPPRETQATSQHG
jgi:lantibiotic modifying enzyme